MLAVMSANRSYGDQCGVARGLDIIGERWALLIIRELLLGPKRFSDLMHGLPGASPNVISQRLRELTGDGVIRQVDLGPPSRVKLYELTEWGRELDPVLLWLGQWGEQAPLPQGTPPSLDSLLLALRSKADPALIGGQVYELRVDADVISVSAAGGAPRLARERPAHPDATLVTDSGTLRAVSFGQRTVEDAERAGALSIDGKREGLIAFLLTLVSLLTVHPVMQHEEREAEHPERVFRPQLALVGDVDIEPLGEPAHHPGRQLAGAGIDVGEVVPGMYQGAARIQDQSAAGPGPGLQRRGERSSWQREPDADVTLVAGPVCRVDPDVDRVPGRRV